MDTLPVTRFTDLPALTRIGIAWGVLWRGLAAMLSCAVGGVLIGVTLGFIVALATSASEFNSWHEAWEHYSYLFVELLKEIVL